MRRRFRFRKVHKVILISLAGLLLVAGIALYSAKGWLLDLAIAKAKTKLKAKYGLTLTIGSYRLDGLSHLEMHNLLCLDSKNDTVTSFRDMTVVIKPWAALVGKIRLREFTAANGMLDITRIKAIKSKTAEAAEPEEDSTKFGKVKKYTRYLRRLAAIVPDRFRVTGLRMSYRDSADKLDTYVDLLTYREENFTTAAILKFKGRKQLWMAKGTFDKSSLETHMDLRTTGPAFYSVNFLKKLVKADVGFTGFHFDLDEFDEGDEEIALKGKVNADNVYIYSPKVSDDTVEVKTGGSTFDAVFTPEHLTLSPESRIRMNGVEATLSGDYAYRSPETVMMKIRLPRMPAQKLVEALPQGTFTKTRGMELAGDMSYKLDFYVDLTNKDSIHIDSDPEGYGLKVIRYGEANLGKLNTSFTYYPYNSRRGIIVGPENPDFTPLGIISPYLKDAVLTCEDPSFFYHHGFVESSFEQSFLENLRTHRFQRGGSTISMQLVKNVFLSHEKTIERKLEEAFLVWLIENLHLSSKSRMFEVYLNIIEWGPNVYGIGEASRFYYKKSPSSLSLNEAIYLAIIIPKPLAFSWTFDPSGNLKGYMQSKASYIARVMSRRGLASVDSSYQPNVYLSGPARGYLKITRDSTTVQPDTLEDFDLPRIPEFFRKLKSFFQRKDK